MAGPAAALTVPTASFDVYAKENSLATASHDASPLDTGLTFAIGDAVEISASGLWNGGACGDVGPGGTACFGDGLPGINDYSLIGRIGDGSYFKVGERYSGIAATEGNLFLAYLDTDSFNNSGFVSAVVNLPPAPAVPEPETWVPMIGGLGLISLWARRHQQG